MKNLEYLAILGALVLLWYLVKTRETFVPEFLDQTNVKKTHDTSMSSYTQDTNHVRPTPALLEKPMGMETPFRVNQWNSFQPV